MVKIFFLLPFPILMLVLLLHSSVDTPLRKIMEASPPDSVLSVIVVMKDRVDLEGLRRTFESSKSNFDDRHLQTITALKGKARAAQEKVLTLVDNLVTAGEVREYRPYWVISALAVKATPGAIAKLAAREDVESVYLDRKFALPLRSSKPFDGKTSSSGFQPNLGIIGADSLWRLGYTGRGVLVCTLDSGVDESHPALSSKWRGNKGFPPSECWFDPYNHSILPADDDLSGGSTHGTGVMGIIVGSSGADTVGVAPGATWIAANAFEADNSGSETSTTGILIDCLQWAADPDGDPATTEDVPRVINNSWGTSDLGGMICEDFMYEVIDAVELAGAALFFSAGNNGARPKTIASPASRVTSPVNAFAVGSVTGSLDISSFSSRGPSTCDGSTIKPEVVAPGSNIMTARGSPSGGYHSMSGTSFSSPHAAGAAALLLDANPLLTSDEVKYALLNSAQDLGTQGDDNTFGMGLIDLPSALGLIGSPPAPSISIVEIDYEGSVPTPGETFNLILTLRNSGAALTSLDTELTTNDSLFLVSQPDYAYGDLSRGGELDNSGDPFVVQIDSRVHDGASVPFRLILTWSGGSTDTLSFTIVAGTDPKGGYGDHDAGNVTFTITNFGQYGYFNGVELKGNGFMFPRGETNWLYHGGFLAATSSSQVSDGTDGGESDWQVLQGGTLTFSSNGEIADQEGYAAFYDGRASSPMGLRILQRSFAYSDSPNGDYVILACFMINSNGEDTLANLYAGLYFDWDIDAGWYDQNYVDWLPEQSLGYMWGEYSDEHMGVSLLSHTPTSYRAIDNPTYVYEGFSDAEKFNFLSGGFSLTRGGTPSDWSQMLSVGPFTIAPLDTIAVVYAVLGGEDLADLRENAVSAQAKYEEIKDLLHLVIIPPAPPTPHTSTLSQNYPNPFMPSEAGHTTIWYSVGSAADSVSSIPVSIKMYDIRGRLVKDFRDNLDPKSPQLQGEYKLEWDGTDDRGALLPSGIYLYRLEMGDSEITRKLILIN